MRVQYSRTADDQRSIRQYPGDANITAVWERKVTGLTQFHSEQSSANALSRMDTRDPCQRDD
jgi:hypothetical protein